MADDLRHTKHEPREVDELTSSDALTHGLKRSTGQQKGPSGSIFSRFTFLRSSEDVNEVQQDDPPRSKKSIDDDGSEGRLSIASLDDAPDLERSNTVKPRKRKGSLRKSALLGVRRLASDGKERRSSLLQRSPVKDVKHNEEEKTTDEHMHNSIRQGGGRTPFVIGSASSSSSSLGSVPPVAAVSTSQETTTQHAQTAVPVHKVPVVYSSTTEDDDDAISIPHSPKLSTSTTAYTSIVDKPSYFPPQPARVPSRPAQRLRPSPLQKTYSPAPEPYSYTETEYWGWVILFITWLVFTVGMGSCLDIWSWAWDVGETPYAPPELEDDPTLPIVGYYPALIVLTGVVAWIWITVAWVGMKYFRHAKIEV